MNENEISLRVSIVALFVEGDRVLLLHQMTLPEPDCWDLPGGGLLPEEALLEGLRREVEEETGMTEFQIKKLLTVTEQFYTNAKEQKCHGLNIVYLCKMTQACDRFISNDPYKSVQKEFNGFLSKNYSEKNAPLAVGRLYKQWVL